MKQNTLAWRPILALYLTFLRRYRVSQVVILTGYGVGALCTSVAVPLIYKGIVDAVSTPTHTSFAQIDELLLLLVCVIIVYNIGYRVADYALVRSQSAILKELTDYALRVLSEKSYTFYTNTFTGGLITKVKRFVRAFGVLHDQFVFKLWMNGIELVSTLLVLWYLSPILGFIFLVWFLLYGALVRTLVHYTIPKNMENAEADSKVTGHLSDIITNMMTVKIFGAATHEQEAFEKVTAGGESKRYIAWMQNGVWNTLYQGAMINIFEVLLVFAAVALLKSGTASAGLVMIVIVYVLRSFNIVWQISRNAMDMSLALTDAHEMIDILETPPGVRDPEKPEEVRIVRGQIVFDGMEHGYENSSRVFAGLSLEIPAGKSVALVGHSGAGKTTFVKLLLRFVDITKGAILIDGQDITHIRQDDLRQKIAYVPQEPILFHRSLFENISYGRPHATRGEVIEASRRARAHEFIERLPHGYDTLVGERGVKLSGGERQRVAIARALLKDAPIIVLDEATSSLDSVSERAIQSAFDELMRGKTTIVIAHRLSTIQHMDEIIVLAEGAVVERGTHKELLAKEGTYAELWSAQVDGFLRDDDAESAETDDKRVVTVE